MSEDIQLKNIIDKATSRLEATVKAISSIQISDSSFKANVVKSVNKCYNECSILLELALDYDDLYFPSSDIRKQLKFASEILSDMVSFTENMNDPPEMDLKSSSINESCNKENSYSLTNYHRQVHFHDIIGCIEAKQSLFESVILPYKIKSTIVRNMLFGGIRQGSSNVLLYGPPGNYHHLLVFSNILKLWFHTLLIGTGKTILVEATACECDAHLFIMRPSDILSKYQGDSEKFIQATFAQARECKRAIIFFDGMKHIFTD